MTVLRPFGIDAGFPNAADFRLELGGIVAREGVFPDPVTIRSDAGGIAYAGSGWGINCRDFIAGLRRGTADYSRAYGTALDGNDAVVVNAWTVPSAPVSGTQITALCIRGRDSTKGDPSTGAPTDGPGGAARTGFTEFGIFSGNTSGSQPVVPAGWLEVARISVAAGNASAAAATITQTAKFAQIVGGTLYVRTASALPLAAVCTEGEVAYAIDTKATYRFTGGAWIADDSGFVAVTPGSGWAALNATYTPTVRRVGKLVTLQGALAYSSGSFASMAIIPAGYRPVGPAFAGVGMFANAGATAGGAFAGAINVGTDGTVALLLPYAAGTASPSQVILSGSWYTA